MNGLVAGSLRVPFSFSYSTDVTRVFLVVDRRRRARKLGDFPNKLHPSKPQPVYPPGVGLQQVHWNCVPFPRGMKSTWPPGSPEVETEEASLAGLPVLTATVMSTTSDDLGHVAALCFSDPLDADEVSLQWEHAEVLQAPLRVAVGNAHAMSLPMILLLGGSHGATIHDGLERTARYFRVPDP